jgi:methyl-accepting chemotaxis protein
MRIVNNMKIGKRLSFGFGMMQILFLIIGGAALIQMYSVGGLTKAVVKADLPKVEAIGLITGKMRENSQLTGELLLQIWSGKDRSKTHQTIIENQKTISKTIDFLDNQTSDDEAKRLLNDLKDKRNKYIAEFVKFDKFISANQIYEAQTAMMEQMPGFFDALQKSGANLQKYYQDQIDARGEHAEETVSQSLIIQVSLGVIALVIGFFWSTVISRSIVGPLKEAVAIAERVAHGDLSSHIESGRMDEVGDLLTALRNMNDNLVRIVTEVRNGTSSISTASSQIASGNRDLSSRTEQQASSLEETASSMEELTSTVRQNADNAKQANRLAHLTSTAAIKGGEVVGNVVATMGEISASSQQISDIISVIEGIAFQTNILALNAAVEAARAGEQGRGFAVVAAEVRSLAQRSATAAVEIKKLIEASVSKVEVGCTLVAEAGKSIQDVVSSVQRLSDLVEEISSASNEQSSGIELVSRAVTQIDDATQQNAALVEQAAAASISLTEQASGLSKAVSVFRI